MRCDLDKSESLDSLKSDINIFVDDLGTFLMKRIIYSRLKEFLWDVDSTAYSFNISVIELYDLMENHSVSKDNEEVLVMCSDCCSPIVKNMMDGQGWCNDCSPYYSSYLAAAVNVKKKIVPRFDV